MSKVICWLCKNPIKGKVHYQGGSTSHPSHKGCLVVTSRPKPKPKENRNF